MATIGYYDVEDRQSISVQQGDIENGGHTAVHITDPNVAQLASIDTLFIRVPNDEKLRQYTARAKAIAEAVNDGMTLIISDSAVTNAESILPGGASIETIRDPSEQGEVCVADDAPSWFKLTRDGLVDDTSINTRSIASYGHTDRATLPSNATALLTTSDPTQVLAFSYPFGDGNVLYATLPIDDYTGAKTVGITRTEIDALFGASNHLLCFAQDMPLLTENGETTVQSLEAGALLKTPDGGCVELRKVHSTHVSASDMRSDENLCPVRICAGALGNGIPTTDLVVSRHQHVLFQCPIAERMFGQKSILIEAIHLTKLPGIYVDTTIPGMTYYHLTCDRHELLSVNGVWCESMSQATKTSQKTSDHASKRVPNHDKGTSDTNIAQLMPCATPALLPPMFRHASNNCISCAAVKLHFNRPARSHRFVLFRKPPTILTVL